MRYLITAALVLAGIIHLVPLIGVLGADRLQGLYGIVVDEPNLAILMRHRAVLFGLVGGFLLLAAFKPTLQPIGFVIGFTSIVTFLLIAWTTGGYNAHIARIVTGDLIALVCLLIGLAAYALTKPRPL